MTFKPWEPYDLPDSSVDEALNQELVTLLSTCFVKPGDEVFKRQRFFTQMPQHRWLVRDESGALKAHVAVHLKTWGCQAGDLSVGAVAEVCVHPQARGRGLVKTMLACLHSWLKAKGVPYAVLFGDPKVYGSSGYRVVDNILVITDPKTGEKKEESGLQALCLGDLPWPKGKIDLKGPKF